MFSSIDLDSPLCENPRIRGVGAEGARAMRQSNRPAADSGISEMNQSHNLRLSHNWCGRAFGAGRS